MQYVSPHRARLLALAGAAASILCLPFLANAQIASTLSLGSSGSDVTELQQFLAQDASIYPEGLVTGYYGTLTQAAVEKYQCANGIVCTGTASSTGYGSVGPQTRASINAKISPNGTAGGGGSPYDVSAPIMSSVSIATTSTSATFTWTTNEPAKSRIMYGTTWPFLYASAPSVSDPNMDTTQTVTVNGLSPNTTYWFVRESVDASGNVMWTLGAPVRTGS